MSEKSAVDDFVVAENPKGSTKAKGIQQGPGNRLKQKGLINQYFLRSPESALGTGVLIINFNNLKIDHQATGDRVVRALQAHSSANHLS